MRFSWPLYHVYQALDEGLSFEGLSLAVDSGLSL